MSLSLPTEPIGSIPRPRELIDGFQDLQNGKINFSDIEKIFDAAVKDTIRRFEETGSPVITDGEQRKHSFITYPLFGLKNLSANGVVIPFEDGHTRQLPALSKGPFRYSTYASTNLIKAKKFAKKPLKQAVISASAMSLLYPAAGISEYSKEEFIADLIGEAEKDIRQCLNEDVSVQIDFTEGRLAVKLDPSKSLLKSFIDLNNRVLDRFTDQEKLRIGVHTCPGGDHDSTHSADVNYADFLPEFFQLNVGSFFVQLASESDRKMVLKTIRPFARDKRRIFVGVTDPIKREIETPEQVKSRILEAVDFISPDHLGTTDDCGFSPFSDDLSTSREVAFEKIRARVLGTQLAIDKLGL
ncbi:MAG: 5-methyltetrahydropteroyltriglutamate--homocysteine methyltransferase [Proteobacteria bacterium SG_bin7]|nr:MAG: 5-methyltetrahydropteroyltriglutamate--homocysteine methyltransferase [Proteobacteria bacterium SG_bin7]